jgi:hypothetical protein
MKNKIVMLMLGLCLSVSIVGCTNTSSEMSSKVDKLETTESSTQESTEDISTTEDDIVEVAEDDTTESEDTFEVEELTAGEANIAQESNALLAEVVEVVTYSDFAKSQDKSAEYDFNSKSSQDAFKYLKEDMSFSISALGDQGKVGNNDYTQRFLYPQIQPNKFYDKIEITYQSDLSLRADCFTEGEPTHVINIYLGYDNYTFTKEYDEEADGLTPCVEFDTVVADGEEVMVYRVVKEYEEFGVDYSKYLYTLGAFTVSVQNNTDYLYTIEDLQQIVDTIVLQ